LPMLRAQPVEGPNEINRGSAIRRRHAECEVVVDLGEVDSCTPAALKTQHIHVKVEQDGSKPARHALRVVEGIGAPKRALYAILNEIIGDADATRQRGRIAPQSGKVSD
jgi:hypothetical protein